VSIVEGILEDVLRSVSESESDDEDACLRPRWKTSDLRGHILRQRLQAVFVASHLPFPPAIRQGVLELRQILSCSPQKATRLTTTMPLPTTVPLR
jgi:hypothetical protein